MEAWRVDERIRTDTRITNQGTSGGEWKLEGYNSHAAMPGKIERRCRDDKITQRHTSRD
jgi:hypothetical protein